MLLLLAAAADDDNNNDDDDGGYRAFGLRGRVQVRVAGKQLPLSWCFHSYNATSTHVSRRVSTSSAVFFAW